VRCTLASPETVKTTSSSKCRSREHDSNTPGIKEQRRSSGLSPTSHLTTVLFFPFDSRPKVACTSNACVNPYKTPTGPSLLLSQSYSTSHVHDVSPYPKAAHRALMAAGSATLKFGMIRSHRENEPPKST